MGRVRSRDTGPELTVRRLVHSLGYRYRLHARDLPGHPDLVFRPRMKVIFIHGCFWHRHHDCELTRMPKSRQGFWFAKFKANRLRDRRTERALRRAGWQVLTVWECEIQDAQALEKRIRRFLDA
ncbi:MAG: very short patch repair endonuclease [Acidobacteria bacterium RIFCSPLOWO2_02_FULL_59_13]|nr:MAG: very short patch repair endonuclease [Acidobacteria bacterium RIFCSPLOWO2_02_FULL_59_13]